MAGGPGGGGGRPPGENLVGKVGKSKICRIILNIRQYVRFSSILSKRSHIFLNLSENRTSSTLFTYFLLEYLSESYHCKGNWRSGLSYFIYDHFRPLIGPRASEPIIKEVKEAGMFSIAVDCTTDNSHKDSYHLY